MQPDLSILKKGSLFGISLYGAIRNIGVVDSLSDGIVKAHAIIGQFQITAAGPDAPEGIRRLAKGNACILNGGAVSGMEIAYTGEIPSELQTALLEADRKMKGKSTQECKRIYDTVEDAGFAAMTYMNKVINDPEPELPLRFPS